MLFLNSYFGYKHIGRISLIVYRFMNEWKDKEGLDMLKILVPIDGSDYSQKALLKAKEIATAMDGEVTILNVVNLQNYNDYTLNRYNYTELLKVADENSMLLLEEAKKGFMDLPINIEIVSKKGDPSKAIIELAEEGGFYLIVMGSRGLGVFSRTLLGSVSDKVIHHVDTSVLIVK